MCPINHWLTVIYLVQYLKNFFHATPTKKAEYMQVPYKYFPNDIRQKYSLAQKVHNNSIYIQMKKGMYVLKQVTVLAYNNLIQNLAPFGYAPIPYTDSYWQHKIIQQNSACVWMTLGSNITVRMI